METLFDKVKKDESRVNRELNEHARSRIMNSHNFYYKTQKRAYNHLRGKVGAYRIPDSAISSANRSSGRSSTKPSNSEKWELVYNDIIRDADTVIVFTFIQLLDQNRVGSDGPSTQDIRKKISDILETENMLWEVNQDKKLEFERIISEEMQNADKRLRGSFRDGDFQRSMEAYNEAWRMFSDEDFSYKIPEKLYNSIEEVLKEICVEKEGWLDSKELSHRKYLEELSDREIFYPNKIMRAEAEDLMDSMEKFVSKAGKERKNQHSNIDEEYSRLLIHQTAAYLDFIITRYQSGDFRG